MKQLQAIAISGKGTLSIDDSPLGKGGEGSVYSVVSHQVPGLDDAKDLVAKIYHNPKEGNRFEKVQAMVQSKPDSEAFAWPVAILGNAQGFQGYLMKKLDSSGFRQWADLSNSRDRRRSAPDFDLKYAITACRNLGVAITSAHHAKAIIGDVNESNIFVGTDASVLIVDTDSAQIEDKKGNIYPCTVGKPEYTAAELSHGSFKDSKRTEETDIFAFAVACFQMITGGGHPMDAVYEGKGDPPSTVDKIRKGIMPSLASTRSFKPVPRVASEAIPLRIKSVMAKSLSPDPAQRVDIDTWTHVFDDVIEHLVQCKKNSLHWYDERDAKKCPLCKRISEGKNDPWTNESIDKPKPAIKPQSTLPPVGFKTAAAAPVKAPRASVAPTPQQMPPMPPMPSPMPAQPTQRSATNASMPARRGSRPMQMEETKIPKLIKGKYVVHYADGTYGPRPPLSRLFQSNPKIAVKAIKEETIPGIGFWWFGDNNVPHRNGLIVGLILALLISASWYFLIPMIPLENYVAPKVAEQVIYYYRIIAPAMGASASLFFFGDAIYSTRSKMKRYGNLNSFKQDSAIITLLKIVPVPIVWGPIAIVVIVISIALWALIAILEMMVDPSKRR